MTTMRSLERLFRPKSIAVIGGGAWCCAVVEQCQKTGFEGTILPVHPTRELVAGVRAYPALSALPYAPDAAFIGVNRKATIEMVTELRDMNAGGAVCFASGFKEAEDGQELNVQLLEAARDFPILGPNCYGILNALDNVSLWPDQHGLQTVSSGVAIIAQSSNIALNMTMQRRGLPIAYTVTVGNQLQQGLADIGLALIEDPRVTALGLYIESFTDIRSFEALGKRASELGKPIAALKVGRSDHARAATVSHTASIAGTEAGADALMRRLGIARTHSIAVFLEVLKLFHVHGRLPGNRIASLSCSGGEAALIADTAEANGLIFSALTDAQKQRLRSRLAPVVHLANPLDYHTGIWRDRAAMADVFATLSGPQTDLTIIALDFPRGDPADWLIALDAIDQASAITGKRFAVVASLPENMPEEIAERCIANGIAPLCDFDHACAAIAAAGSPNHEPGEPVLLATAPLETDVLSEFNAKTVLGEYGVPVPSFLRATSEDRVAEVAGMIGYPVVIKGEGITHKSEGGNVAIGIANADDATMAASAMASSAFLVEELIEDPIAELLVGVIHDPQTGYVMTVAAGGVMTELFDDRQHLLLPSSEAEIENALSRLKISALLNGFRGKSAADWAAIVKAIMAVQRYVFDNAGKIAEVEINPLICTRDNAIAADALIVKGRKAQ